MKKIFITMLTALVSQSALYALPVGSPADASAMYDGLIWNGGLDSIECDQDSSFLDAFSLRFGFYGDYVFNRSITAQNVDKSLSIQNASISMNTNAAFLAFNLFDRVDLFGTIGFSNISVKGGCPILAYYNKSNDELPIVPSFVKEIKTPSDYVGGHQKYSCVDYHSTDELSWSAGLRSTIFEAGDFSVGLEGQYFAFSPNTSYIMIAPFNSVYRVGSNNSAVDNTSKLLRDGLKYQEWQVGMGMSYRLNILTPYVAVKWSQAKLDTDKFAFAAKVDNDNNPLNGESGDNLIVSFRKNIINKSQLGYAVGFNLVDSDKASVGVEGRFGDETAVSVTGQFRF